MSYRKGAMKDKTKKQLISEVEQLRGRVAELESVEKAHKERVKELYGKEERLRLALQGGDLGTLDWNLKNDRVEFNERWAEMKGYSLDELEPKLQTWEDLVHPDDLPGAYEKLNAHFEGETDFYEAEFRMKHKTGKWIWILDRGEVVERDKEGNSLRVCGHL